MTSSLKRTFLAVPAIEADIIKFVLFTQQFQCACKPVTRHLELNLRTNKSQNTRKGHPVFII